MQRRTFLQSVLSIAGLPVATRAQAPAAWPAKSIRFIVPYQPGSAPDVIARMLAERLGPTLGQPLVIENRPGAGGNIGGEMIARAAPDGYTVGLGTSAIVTNPWLYRKIGFDPVTDFVGLNLSITMPHLLVVAPDSPVKSVADLVRLLKSAPGKYNYASGGNGSGAHLAAELFKTTAGVDMTHVPYKGAPDILTSVIGKSTFCGFPTLATAVPLVKAGSLRAVAVTRAKRNHILPDVPTLSETFADFDFGSWFGVIGPAKMSPEVVRRFETEAHKALQVPAFRDRIQSDGSEVVNLNQADFEALIKVDYAKYKRIVELSGARID